MKEKVIVGILQARVGSSRLDAKVLKEIKEKSLLELYLRRVEKSKLMNKIIVATTIDEGNFPIVDVANKLGVDCFRGSENDLLDRYYQCAKNYGVDIIVRLCCDDPFVDHEVIDRAVQILIDEDADWVTNHFETTYPEGLDIDVFPFSILEETWKEATLKSEREHVFPYVFNNKDQFKFINFKQDVDYSSLRWTIDYQEDLDMASSVYDYLYDTKEVFLQDDILKLIEEHPEIMEINRSIEHYAGIKKSFREDKEL